MEIAAIILLTLCAAAALTVPWYRGNRPRWITASILLLLATPIVVEEYRMHSVESFFTASIQQYSGNNSFTVECDRFSDYFVQTSQRAGEVWFDADGTPSNSTQLMYRTCDALKALPTQLPRNITIEEAFALHVLSHELQHLEGIQDEAKAECYAHQNNPNFFSGIGVLNSDIVAHANWNLNYTNLPSRYRSAECRDNGALDLNLAPNVFVKP